MPAPPATRRPPWTAPAREPFLPALALALALSVALVLPADAADGPAPARDLAVRPGSTLSYRLVHRLHEVVGTARAVEGRARLLPDGRVQAMVRARVDAFDSGNGNRDAHMQEATEAARFPYVTLKAAGALAPPAAYPAAVEVALRGELTFHGVTRAVEVPARVAFASAGRASVAATLPVSLEAHGVERPALLFVKVDDALLVTAALELSEDEP